MSSASKKAAAFRDSPAFASVQLADLPPHVGAVDWSLDAPLPASLPLIPLANLRESECRSESQSGSVDTVALYCVSICCVWRGGRALSTRCDPLHRRFRFQPKKKKKKKRGWSGRGVRSVCSFCCALHVCECTFARNLISLLCFHRCGVYLYLSFSCQRNSQFADRGCCRSLSLYIAAFFGLLFLWHYKSLDQLCCCLCALFRATNSRVVPCKLVLARSMNLRLVRAIIDQRGATKSHHNINNQKRM